MALFKDSDAAAVATNETAHESAGAYMNLGLMHSIAAGSTSAQTFKCRIGPNAGTMYFNGDHLGNRIFGASSKSNITIIEVGP